MSYFALRLSTVQKLAYAAYKNQERCNSWTETQTSSKKLICNVKLQSNVSVLFSLLQLTVWKLLPSQLFKECFDCTQFCNFKVGDPNQCQWTKENCAAVHFIGVCYSWPAEMNLAILRALVQELHVPETLLVSRFEDTTNASMTVMIRTFF